MCFAGMIKVKITHVKLISRKKEDAFFRYLYLVRIKLNFLLSSHYICTLTTTDSEITEEQLKNNMRSIDVSDLLSSELQSSAQRMWLRSNFYETELGKLYADKFEHHDYMLFGKEKEWKYLQCTYE